jgi:hypothetical protein
MLWKGKSFGQPTAFIARGQRELRAGPSGWRRTPASSRTGEPSARAGFPYSTATDRWASVSVLNVAWVWTGTWAALFIDRPVTPNFLISPNWTEFVKYENHLYVAPKFIKLCNLIQWKVWNNFPFGRKFKFQVEFELKVLEAKFLLNSHWILCRFKHVWKNLINSLKFILALALRMWI